MKNKSIIKPLSSKEYVNTFDGAACPLCLSSNIISDPVDADGSTGYANNTCGDCGAEWTDIWTIYKYSNLNEGITPERKEEILRKAKEIRNLTIR